MDRDEILRRLSPEIRTMVGACANAVTRAQAAEREAERHRQIAKRLLYQLRVSGLSQGKLGLLVGLSRSRVAQITKALRA